MSLVDLKGDNNNCSWK